MGFCLGLVVVGESVVVVASVVGFAVFGGPSRDIVKTRSSRSTLLSPSSGNKTRNIEAIYVKYGIVQRTKSGASRDAYKNPKGSNLKISSMK